MNQFTRIVGLILFSLLLVLALGVAILESRPGRVWVQSYLVSAIGRSGVPIEIGSLEGTLPQQLILRDVKIQGVGGKDLAIDELELQIGLLRLLKRELYIEFLRANTIVVTPSALPPRPESSGQGLPFSLNIRSFVLENVQLPEAIHATGKFRLKRNNRSTFLKCLLSRPEFPHSLAEITAFKRRVGGEELHLSLQTPTLEAFKPWISLQAEGPLALQMYVQGNRTAYAGKVNGTFTAEKLFLPFPLDELGERAWVFRGNFRKKENAPLQLRNLLASSQHLRLKGSADLTENYSFSRGKLGLQTDLHTLPHSEFSGRLNATANLQRANEGLDVEGSWTLPSLDYRGLTAKEIKGTFTGNVSEKATVGSAQVKGLFASELWEGTTGIAFRPKEAFILENISLRSPLLEATGTIAHRADGFWTGKIDSSLLNLQLIQRAYPAVELYGNGTGTFSMDVVQEEAISLQALHTELDVKEIYLTSAYAKEANLRLDWREDIKGNLAAKIDGIKYEQLFLDSAFIETSSGEENWPFQIRVDGTLKDPLHLALNGFWRYRNQEFSLTLENGSGTLLNYPVSLLNPVTLDWSPEILLFKDFRGAIGAANLYFTFEGNPEETDSRLLLDRVPLDFLSLNPLELPVTGTISLDATLRERKNRVEGELHASIENLEVQLQGENDPLLAQGTFDGTFNRDTLEIKGGLEVRDAPLLTLDMQLPIHFELWPFQAKLLLDKTAKGHLAMQGRIEDFLDFFDLGMHRFEGECTCDLTLRNTLRNPRLEGYCEIENGYYQNYLSGTELINLRADILADYKHIYLRSLSGQDGKKKGNLRGSGELTLSLDDRFPFLLDLSFDRLNVVQIDFISTEAEGNVVIEGNLDSALARGTVKIVETDMTIPDRIPRQLPNLQVIYKNAPKPIVYTAPHLVSPYPLHLDLNVQAPDGIFIGGRGLQSEWKGDFHIGGTYTAIAPKGKLELVSGEFVFAGRTFKLTEGSVGLAGNEKEMPHLDISGTMVEKGVSITARLRGPINQPQLTFQSVPPLPLSGILSYLLFGQDLSEIDGFQALQLASTVATISGESADILENTRKSLGIDRLRIITSPGSEEGEDDTIALQVGKYVAKGVLVSFSQGAEDSSTNISIEVDIGNGFFFQAESDQRQEQGKFSLKWNRNY